MAKQETTTATSDESLQTVLASIKDLQAENMQLRGLVNSLQDQVAKLHATKDVVAKQEDYDPAKDIERRRSVALRKLQEQREARNKGAFAWEFKILKHKNPLIHFLDTEDDLTARSLIEQRIGTRWDSKKMHLKYLGTRKEFESAQKRDHVAA